MSDVVQDADKKTYENLPERPQRLGTLVRERGERALSIKQAAWIKTVEKRLDNIPEIVGFYEVKALNASVRTAKDAMRVVAQAIDSAELHGAKPTLDSEPP